MSNDWKPLALEELQARIERGELETPWGPRIHDDDWTPAVWFRERVKSTGVNAGKYAPAPRCGTAGQVSFGGGDFFERHDAFAWEDDAGRIVFQHGANPPPPGFERTATYIFRPKGSTLSFAGVVLPNEDHPAFLVASAGPADDKGGSVG